MVARQARGQGRLAELARDRQNAIGQWRKAWKEEYEARSQNKPDSVVRSLEKHVAKIAQRLSVIDRELNEKFPEFASLTRPRVLSAPELQLGLLRDEEVLFLYHDVPDLGGISEDFLRGMSEDLLGRPLERDPGDLDRPGKAFAWAVTRREMRWIELPDRPGMIGAHLFALRCGLDVSKWADDPDGCRGLLRVQHTDLRRSPPFDLARGFQLYQALFLPFEDLIRGKKLIVVQTTNRGTGSLSSIPPHVLVTQAPEHMAEKDGALTAIARSAQDFRETAWLTRSHAISVLPSVASIKALRSLGRSAAPHPYMAFGNPLLNGDSEKARVARQKYSCLELPQREKPEQEIVDTSRQGRASDLFRGGMGDVKEIDKQHALPNTADEICEVRQVLRAPLTAIYLGEKATEKNIKRASVDGLLKNSRIVHFATHGLKASETQQSATRNLIEPALILTPPKKATVEDDGLLTMSEIGELKLDADWVILSACNTATSAGDDFETLSGFARAFFNAGARALLVSHWYVGSKASQKLISRTFANLEVDPRIGRSEALRRSMLELLDNGEEAQAHPARWAPFVVVGDD